MQMIYYVFINRKLGDFNARTSNKDNFITYDVIQNDILEKSSETDTVLPTRVNPDETVN